MWLKIVFLCIFGCINCLTSSFDLGGVLSGNRMAGVPLGRSLGDGEVDVEGICSESGMACQNCSHAVTCVPLPVGWLKVPLQQCTEGLTCNAHRGQCSEQIVPECDVVGQKYQHTCEQVGIFPDAFDCRKFHLCSPPEGLPGGRPADHRTALCPRHYGYNPRTAQCSIKLQQGQCTEKPVPDCKTVGQTDVLPFSPNHYYVCLWKLGALYPQVFICPHGWFFWDGFCRPEPQIINTRNNGGNGRFFGPTEGDLGPIDNNFGPHHGDLGPNAGDFGPNARDFGPNAGDFGPNDRDISNEIFEPSTERYGPQPDIHPTEEEKVHSDETLPSEKDKAYSSFHETATMTKMEAFFSTEKPTTYAADTFLADKFDLANYESTDDVAPPMDEFTNSFESGAEFW